MTDFDRVEAKGLAKTYGATRALAGVDLTLRGGQVTVVEGPNGAGKSTLLSLLTLQARPTRGTLHFGALDAVAHAEALRPFVGVLSHASFCYPDLTGAENLVLAARLHRVADAAKRIQTLRERFDIGAFGDRAVRTFSRGQLQRVALARALVAEPRLLLLDEPSTGLDARSTELLVEVVRGERARGAIVVVVTHDASLSENVADVRVTLRQGRLAEAA
ncbi:MAG: ABC transporter ATP-binding protein [Sandaracinus sp.]